MSLKSPEQKTGRLVVPGERLGVIEEFIPDAGTFVKDCVIYSKIVGRALVDLMNKRVSVYPLVNSELVPKVGTEIIGQIGNPQSDNVLVKIFKKTNSRISGEFSGILHISDVSDRYIDSMNDVCKPGDIIRAKVISTKNRIDHLSTNDKNLGVLYAFCSRCGGSLESLRYDELRCPKCGNVEKRKVAPDYGQVQI
jgi:exosome complex component CSL4